MLQFVNSQEKQKKNYSLTKKGIKFAKPIHQPPKEISNKRGSYRESKNIKNEANIQRRRQLKNAFESVHGRFTQRIRNADIDLVKTNRWLKSSGL